MLCANIGSYLIVFLAGQDVQEKLENRCYEYFVKKFPRLRSKCELHKS